MEGRIRLSVAALLLALGACEPRASTAAPATVTDAQATRPRLRWTEQGDRLVVGDRWQMDPATGALAPWDAKPLLVEKGWVIRGGPEGPLPRPLRIPVWIDTSDPDHGDPEIWAENLAVPIDAKTIYVHQQNPHTGTACRLLDVTTLAFREPAGGCITGGLLRLVRLERAPGDRLAVWSAVEGIGEMRLMRYREERAQHDGGIVIHYGSDATFDVVFAPDGDALWVAGTCKVTITEDEAAARGCDSSRPDTCKGTVTRWGVKLDACDPDGAAWLLHRVEIATATVTLLRSDLPTGAIPHPSRPVFGFWHDGKVCVGEPRAPASALCAALPP